MDLLKRKIPGGQDITGSSTNSTKNYMLWQLLKKHACIGTQCEWKGKECLRRFYSSKQEATGKSDAPDSGGWTT